MIHYISADGIGAPWVAVEVRFLMEAGLPVRLHSLRKPSASFFGSPWAKRLESETQYLYPLPVIRVVKDVLLAPFRFGRRFFQALWNALTGERENLRARAASLAHLAVGCHWAAELEKGRVDLIHSQWAHSGATVGMYAAWLLSVPFSFTGHAADLFRNRAALKDKVRRAAFIVCISEFHRQFYEGLGADPAKLHLIYCGIDLGAYVPRFGRSNQKVPKIISLGRLVEKKGFDVLIRACAELRLRGLMFHCLIGGSGPLADSLNALVRERELADYVSVPGKAVLQEDLQQFYDEGTIFAQPCVWSRDNDVDGTPRTLLEAMACGLPAVASRIAGLPDMVIHGQTGLLVEPGNAVELADALERLIESPALSDELARAGRRHVVERFDLEQNLARLAAVERDFVSHCPVAPATDATRTESLAGGPGTW